jgi:Raf kinase inhibitor-like YbhB/YbcL family protein
MNRLLPVLMLLFAPLVQAAGFTLSSPGFSGQMASAQVLGACGGDNVSPALEWKNPPPGTQSFAITMYDPDAPTGSGWWHWVVLDLPADLRRLEAGAGAQGDRKLPGGARHGRTDFGMSGYGGACPPKGDRPHRYVLTVHALDVESLDVGPRAMPAAVGFLINRHSLARASLIAYYGR